MHLGYPFAKLIGVNAEERDEAVAQCIKLLVFRRNPGKLSVCGEKSHGSPL